MPPEASDAFLQGLFLMGECFTDPLSEIRQRLYWSLFEQRCTLEEWQSACLMAMQDETFHKVPTPAVMWDYVKKYRKAQYRIQQALDMDRQAREQAKALENPPLSPDEMQQQLGTLFSQLSEGGVWPAPKRETRVPEYQRPLTDAEQAERKEKLREQLRTLASGEPLYEPPKEA